MSHGERGGAGAGRLVKGVVVAVSLREYFERELEAACENQSVKVSHLAERYLVGLLSDFLAADQFYLERDDGTRDAEPLALLLQRALQAPRRERIGHLRRLGDIALYVAGFFADSLARKLVGPRYYIAMGGTAYGQLAAMMREAPARGGFFSGLYGELEGKFAALVDVFSEISERASVSSDQGVVRLYERWRATGSRRLSRLLAERGVIPTPLSRYVQ